MADQNMSLVVLLVCVCYVTIGDACLPVTMPDLRLRNEVKTFAKTDGKVLHMEADLKNDGNILYSEGASLKTTDGTTTVNLAGDLRIPGYKDARNNEARFRDITGFHQLNKQEVVIADKYNHCLRKVNRDTGVTSTFAGRCSYEGFQDGPIDSALFYHPTGVFGPLGVHSHESTKKDSKLKDLPVFGFLYVTDSGNMAIRRIRVKDGAVKTIGKSASLQGLSYYCPILYSERNVGGFVATNLGIMFINSERPDEVTVAVGSIAGQDRSNTSALFQMDPIFPRPQQFLLSGTHTNDNNDITIIFLDGENSLKAAQIGATEVKTACTGVTGDLDGTFSSCQLDHPSSLLAAHGDLFIGEQGAIRVIPGRESLLDLAGIPPTSTAKPTACKSSNITIYLKPGLGYADVHPTPDINLRLSPGNHVYHDQRNGCFIHIKVLKQQSNLRRRVTITAKYKVDCDLIKDDVGKRVLDSNMDENYMTIEKACSDIRDCVRPSPSSVAQLRCVSGVMTVAWQTNITLSGDVTMVPADLKSELNKRLDNGGVILSAVIVNRNPPILAPEKTAHGRNWEITLTSECVRSLKYDMQTVSCKDI